MVPPVPIPNTAVKHSYADGTWVATPRESRYLPVKKSALGLKRFKAVFESGGSGEVVNTSDCGSDMRGFDSHESPHRGIAQLVEQRSPKP